MLNLCLVLLLGPLVAWGQEPAAEFTEEVFAEEFENNHFQWEQNSNADKFCLLSEGKFFVQRHNIAEPEVFTNEAIPSLKSF